MDTEIIGRHNEFVGSQDVVIHAGDFTLAKRSIAEKYIKRLNGTHIFLKGSHDYWAEKVSQSHLGEGNGRILCGCMSFRHASVASITLQQLAAIRPFPWQTAAHRQAAGHRG
jgi:predicted phosphohydrolase